MSFAIGVDLAVLAEQLRPFLFPETEEKKGNSGGDVEINGKVYKPTINMKELAEIWRFAYAKAAYVARYLMANGVDLGVPCEVAGSRWMIRRDLALEVVGSEVFIAGIEHYKLQGKKNN